MFLAAVWSLCFRPWRVLGRWYWVPDEPGEPVEPGDDPGLESPGWPPGFSAWGRLEVADDGLQGDFPGHKTNGDVSWVERVKDWKDLLGVTIDGEQIPAAI